VSSSSTSAPGNGSPPDAPFTDRRRSARHTRFEEHRIVRARVRPGDDVSLLDVSAGGALVEAAYRLLPGACVEVLLRRDDTREVIRGSILRSSIARLRADVVIYRGAIAFERLLPWFTADHNRG
jgi:hypothetical protein